MLYVPTQSESLLVIIKMTNISNLRQFQESLLDGTLVLNYLIEIFDMNLPKLFHLGINKTEIPKVNHLPNAKDCAVINILINGVNHLHLKEKKIEISELLFNCKKNRVETAFRYIDPQNNVLVVDVKINTLKPNRKLKLKLIENGI